MEENNNLELNNPKPAPLPKPLPELKQNRRDGGFSGAANRFCSDRSPEPVKDMPNFSLGKSGEHPQFYGENTHYKTAVPNSFRYRESASNNENTNVVIPTVNNDNPQGFEGNDFSNQPYQRETIGKFNVPKKEKKSHTALAVFISVVATIMVLVCVFFVFELDGNSKTPANPFEQLYPDETVPNTAQTYPNDFNSYVEQKKSEPSKATTKKPVQDYTDKSYKGISLQGINTKEKNPSAQSAYNKVAGSTVAVLCFIDEVKDEKLADGQGTGIIITSDGYIVTNSHVIGDSKSKYLYQVKDNKGKKYNAYVVGYDTRTDLAVLKISAKNLTSVTFGKSSDLKVGDDIIAVGNPGGVNFQNSLTKGIVSAKERSIDDGSVTYIQTDAAVNPGNSGGPMCNLYGQVVGITTAKISSSVYEGMGFAIPSETIKEITDDIIQKGYVENRVRIGITGFPVNSYTSTMYEVPQGIVIAEISEDGSLANTNAKEGDIITEFDGTKITNFSQVYSLLEKHKPGDKVKITLYRPDSKDSSKGQTITVTATLTADNGESQE
ncbi:MAG: trypsin-like peptidase domain-containing protein [Oscillospiraceae bacterium]|nr:trypsin-like peptidase domain-containing protein [Oscillospiraceae bacterium]